MVREAPKSGGGMSRGEDELAQQLDLVGVDYIREYRFHDKRKWRFDFVLDLDRKIAVEVDGGVWIRGRHNRGKGYISDMDKFNSAVMLGWRVLKFEPEAHIKSGLAVDMILRIMGP